MSDIKDVKDVKEFPDLSNKLAAPKKQSVFERQRAEAEAKRIREEAETAAVYEDFVKSFDDETQGGPGSHGPPRGRAELGSDIRTPAASGPARRHFTATGPRKSGPGSLGVPSLPTKRAHDGSRVDRGRERGIFAFEDSRDSTASLPLDAATAFRASDDEDDKVQEPKDDGRSAPKPTLKLSSLPPGTSIPVIKKLLPENMVIDSVRIVPPSGPGHSASFDRKSMSAIVAFAQDTPASDLDGAVSSLTNKYLGWGFNLSIVRHLSSSTLGPVTATHSALTSLPFGAQPIPQAPIPSFSRAPPPGSHRGGFPPPSSYGAPEFSRPPPLQVKVTPPTDIRQLKLIHKTIEAVIYHGPEFEALLMTRAEVQRDEKWSWLWNPRSQGGVWYRWRLWQILSGVAPRREPTRHQVFEGGVPWLEPEDALPFEFTTQFEEFVEASDYHSSDEDDSDQESEARRRRRHFDSAGGPPDASVIASTDETSYLNPLQKARLTHLLARLPTTTARLRKGDVARVTAFAITHAGQGAEEVVDILVSNVLRPFAFSQHANPDARKERDRDGADADMTGADSESRDHEEVHSRDAAQDTSSATLIGLHLISDILSASSTSGVRHAWRYRAHFESALLSRNIFAYLGRLEKVLGWGRLRAEKWRRSVNNVLQLWEGWCVFPATAQEKFVEGFNNPPVTEEEAKDVERREKAASKEVKSKWRAVDVNAAAEEKVEDIVMTIDVPGVVEGGKGAGTSKNGASGLAVTTLPKNGREIRDDERLVRHRDSSSAGGHAQEMAQSQNTLSSAPNTSEQAKVITEQASLNETSQTVPRKRQRPRAEDMFADDSDGD